MRTTRRYLGCCTSRCTSTTMVFCIFALVTLPVRMVRSPRSATGALCVSVVITPSLLSARARERVFSPAPDLFSLHDRHPLFRRAFALAHARFGRLLGERLVR